MSENDRIREKFSSPDQNSSFQLSMRECSRPIRVRYRPPIDYLN